jgi:HK97 family phage portal protein
VTVIVGPEEGRFEVEPGGGSLATSSVPFSVADSFGWYDASFLGGRPVSYAKIFAEQPWVGIAVMRLLTWAIRVPLKVYRRLDEDGDKQRLFPKDHRLAAAFARPWERGSQAELIMSLLGPLCVHGNDLVDINEGARGEIRFDPIDWRIVMPIRDVPVDPYSTIQGWRLYKPQGGIETRSAETVMHLRWWGPLGNLGISPLQQLRSTITSETAAVEYGVNSLERAWRPNGVVEISDEALKLDPDQLHALYLRSLKDLRANYSGQRNAGKIPVMPPGLSWTDAKQTTAVEAELIQQRLVNRNEIAAAYMIPPPMIGHLEKSTFNNVTTLREMAYTDALAPPLILIEQMLNAHLVQGLLREEDIFVEFDMGLILRGDRLKEIQALREGVSMGIYSPNEARGALHLPLSDNELADELWLPTNNLEPLSAVAPAKGEEESDEHEE